LLCITAGIYNVLGYQTVQTSKITNLIDLDNSEILKELAPSPYVTKQQYM